MITYIKGVISHINISNSVAEGCPIHHFEISNVQTNSFLSDLQLIELHSEIIGGFFNHTFDLHSGSIALTTITSLTFLAYKTSLLFKKMGENIKEIKSINNITDIT